MENCKVEKCEVELCGDSIIPPPRRNMLFLCNSALIGKNMINKFSILAKNFFKGLLRILCVARGQNGANK